LPNARFFALEKRRHDAERGKEARREIRDRGTRAHRSLPGQPRDRHEAAHALRDLVEARPVAVRPSCPKPEMLARTMRGLTFASDS